MYRNIFIKFIFSSFLFVFGCENLDPKDFPNLKDSTSRFEGNPPFEGFFTNIYMTSEGFS